MITLGIHDGHTATAAIARNGKIIACISEERLKRDKEVGGFPVEAIKRCLEICDLNANEIDAVGIATMGEPTLHNSYNKPSFLKQIFGLSSYFLPNVFLRSNLWVKSAQKIMHFFRKKNDHKNILQNIGINTEITYYDHHFLHAATAHLQCPWGKENNLVITNDGSGDAVCATVNIGKGNSLERIETISNYNSMGEFYSRITQYLGMKPMSHEFKVMGLAAYAKPKYGLQTYEQIENWFKIVPPYKFENHSGLWKWQYIKGLEKIFRTKHRFDNIAWAAQNLIEEKQTDWIKMVIKNTGIKNVVLSGGVFLNIKANYNLLQIDDIENLFIFPSGGDESLPMGAALQLQIENGVEKIEPLGPLYFGDEFSDDEILSELKLWNKSVTYNKPENINKNVANELVKGNIIARYFGRMEWGARALGNRSIIADGRNPDVIIKINEAIKNRDFWMPFAPSVLFERVNDYFDNPKEFFGPYMVMAFPSKPLAKKHILGGLHPYDFTGRPQMVKKEWNKDYYELLKAFEIESGGVGGVLNTSFNIHGEAIVRTPKDALETFINSGLDGLALGPYYVSKINSN
jgi:carbamoyltransferase